METTRREFITRLTALPLMGFLSAFTEKRVARLPLTPSCDDGDEPTPAQTEGPYFKPNSPERSSLLETSISGKPLTLSGKVIKTNGQPVSRALLDWWHADDAGEYDNSGFRLRGHQYTDQRGNFRLETIVPGIYSGRTRHLHVKVQAPGKTILTTQLYFPDEPGNRRDRIFNEVLLMRVKQGASKTTADYTFVVNA